MEGFAKEMAVVTHHRLIAGKDGGLVPDPEAKLEEPLVVRPTSETIIGDAMARWVQSWRDLPLKLNQWANVVRWEMRTRMFLRTSEFLWQEGHTAHAEEAEAKEHTLTMLEVYRAFADEDLALAGDCGRKAGERTFPGRGRDMVDRGDDAGRQGAAGRDQPLSRHQFRQASGIKYQNKDGGESLCHTTSWGVSTRMIGGVIMTHGDDDGLRVPPAIAPQQVVILPMLRDKPEDEALIEYCETLRATLAAQHTLGEPLRVLLDTRPGKAAAKRWDYVRKGAPIIIEVGGRDMDNGVVSMLRRDRLWDAETGKPAFETPTREVAGQTIADVLGRHASQLADRSAANAAMQTSRAVSTDFAEVEKHFAGAKYPGWVEVQWSKPTGEELEQVVERLKAHKLTIRNVPMDAAPVDGVCIFTGKPAVERIILAKAY